MLRPLAERRVQELKSQMRGGFGVGSGLARVCFQSKRRSFHPTFHHTRCAGSQPQDLVCLSGSEPINVTDASSITTHCELPQMAASLATSSSLTLFGGEE